MWWRDTLYAHGAALEGFGGEGDGTRDRQAHAPLVPSFCRFAKGAKTRRFTI
jgi:hypothetical protein